MNTERENGQRDPLVSATYRELASEKTPAHLDDKVLQRAARGRRTRYSLAYAWMRPVAWAATIGLCLALVLELSQLPQAPEPEYLPIPDASAPTSPQPLPELDLERAKEQKRESMAPATGKTRQKPVLFDSAPVRDDDSVPERLLVPDADVIPGAGAKEDLRNEPLEETVLDEAAPAAASRLSPQVTGAVSKAADGTASSDEEPVCPAQARATAEEWFACIAELALAGDQELADREFRLFTARYPDFEAPVRK